VPAASFVIDASVAVKWFSLEPGRRQAIKILKKLEIEFGAKQRQ